VPVVVRLAVVARSAPVIARIARIYRGLEIRLAKYLHIYPVSKALSIYIFLTYSCPAFPIRFLDRYYYIL
jgi:hypothetical protein